MCLKLTVTHSDSRDLAQGCPFSISLHVYLSLEATTFLRKSLGHPFPQCYLGRHSRPLTTATLFIT